MAENPSSRDVDSLSPLKLQTLQDLEKITEHHIWVSDKRSIKCPAS